VAVPVSALQLHRLRNLLVIILGGIETNNLPISIQAIRRMKSELDSCAAEDADSSSIKRPPRPAPSAPTGAGNLEVRKTS
jgi:hypothetical protein